MNTYEQLTTLLKSIIALKELPKTGENTKIGKEIREVIGGDGLKNLVQSIMDDYRREQVGQLHAQNTVSSDQSDLLYAYVAYQDNVFYKVKQKAIPSVTDLVNRKAAFNAAKEGNVLREAKQEKTKASEKLEEAFNSIYSDKALQINSQKDPTRLGSYIDYSPYVNNYQDYLAIPTLDQTIDFPIAMATKKTLLLILKTKKQQQSSRKSSLLVSYAVRSRSSYFILLFRPAVA